MIYITKNRLKFRHLFFLGEIKKPQEKKKKICGHTVEEDDDHV